jgi:hypothetical protein
LIPTFSLGLTSKHFYEILHKVLPKKLVDYYIPLMWNYRWVLGIRLGWNNSWRLSLFVMSARLVLNREDLV